MNQLFTIYSSNYKPISFRERYFYDYYEIIHSFLKQKLTNVEIDRLLKPMLSDNGSIKWYGNQTGEFKRITEWDSSIASNVRSEFNQFIQKTQDLANSLKAKRDIENAEWGTLIGELFQHERIILINNNSGNWAMLWGWDFMSNDENRLPRLDPSRKPILPEVVDPLPDDKKDDNAGPTAVNHSIKTGEQGPTFTNQNPSSPKDSTTNTTTIDEPLEEEKPIRTNTPYQNRIGCLGRIKRLLRWISYRFWALFWLIIYTLFIIWLCRYCSKPNCDAYCQKLKKTKKELLDLERRVRERCDTTYVKPN